MTTTPPTTVGPPAPYDPACGAALGRVPEFPPITVEAIPFLRAAEFTPRPTNQELARDGRHTVEEHADQLRIDERRIGLIGGSAGGGIAAALALMARDRGGPSLAGQRRAASRCRSR